MPPATYIKRIALAAVLLTALIFSCRGITLAHGMDHGASARHMACCSISDAQANALLHSQFQTALPGVVILLFASVLLFALARIPFAAPAQTVSYERRIRGAFGSTRLFCYLTPLFSSGILHPKVY